jgi:hypothetical protein
MTPEQFFFNVSQENNEQTFFPEAMLKERVRCTPLSRQFETKIKIDCYTYKLKYTAAGVW